VYVPPSLSSTITAVSKAGCPVLGDRKALRVVSAIGLGSIRHPVSETNNTAITIKAAIFFIVSSFAIRSIRTLLTNPLPLSL
jgi:hypothetical protein